MIRVNSYLFKMFVINARFYNSSLQKKKKIKNKLPKQIYIFFFEYYYANIMST